MPRVEGYEVAPAVGETVTVFRTYVEGRLVYSGPSLEDAARTWDRETHNPSRPMPGGVAVATYEGVGYEPGLLQVRDGWILHVMEDGTVYLNPNITTT